MGERYQKKSFRALLALELIYFGQKKKKCEFCELALHNGGEIQDGRQTRMFHDSVNLHLNHLKLWI
jgi:hypothetical protein